MVHKHYLIDPAQSENYVFKFKSYVLCLSRNYVLKWCALIVCAICVAKYNVSALSISVADICGWLLSWKPKLSLFLVLDLFV